MYITRSKALTRHTKEEAH